MMKRQRGRGRKSGSPSNRSYESNGPDVKIRGNPSHIYEKYMQLARDATSSGDRIMAENYYQHAEHYLRIVQANQPKREDTEAGEEREAGQDARPRNADGADGSDAQGEDASADGEDSGRGRRGRRRRRDGAGEDPLQVVDPEAAESGEAPQAGAEGENDDKPRKRPRTRRRRTDDAAEEALASADGAGSGDESDAGGEKTDDAAA